MIALQVAWFFARDPNVKVDGVIMVDSPFPAYHGLIFDTGSPTPEERPDSVKEKLERSMIRTVDMLQSWRAPVFLRGQQPHTVMLCACQRVICEDEPALSFVDQFRDSPTLGWSDRGTVIDKTYSIQGHHFNIFEPTNASTL